MTLSNPQKRTKVKTNKFFIKKINFKSATTKKLLTFTLSLLFVSFGLFAQEKIIKNFSGSGGKNTRPFEVDDGWELQWNAEGDFFQIYLYNADGSLKGVPANQQGDGEGNSYQANGGKYYLQINAIGEWDVNIVQLNTEQTTTSAANKKDNNVVASFSGSGGKNTRPFNAPSGWEIQWNAKGSLFQIYLYKANGSLVGVPANQQGAGEGNSYQPKKGKYYLQINAMGDWKVNIIDIQE
ncbi:MAG: hypothetical protein K9I68_00245 [Bacteroidales bacterium]|nr:hypothetical protein [Bacteroidales bacterium]MCF8336408.1 hypothetical protein [Bacteroidales bacterium]